MKNITFETLGNWIAIVAFIVFTAVILFGVAIGRIHPTWIPELELLNAIGVSIVWGFMRWF